jgi:hypothetical protein
MTMSPMTKYHSKNCKKFLKLYKNKTHTHTHTHTHIYIYIYIKYYKKIEKPWFLNFFFKDFVLYNFQFGHPLDFNFSHFFFQHFNFFFFSNL